MECLEDQNSNFLDDSSLDDQLAKFCKGRYNVIIAPTARDNSCYKLQSMNRTVFSGLSRRKLHLIQSSITLTALCKDCTAAVKSPGEQ